LNSTSFYSRLIISIVLTFIIHLSILHFLKITLLSNNIIESYLINIFTAILLYYITDKHKSKFKDNIGFIFMLSSFFKFSLFFIFIYPFFDKNSTNLTLEFITFFIPYTICLIIEIIALIKLLKNLDYKN